jgi:hypothetical protein
MSDLMNEINSMAWSPRTLADEVLTEHRTLQQSFGGAVLLTIDGWAEMWESKTYDLRNEDICRKAFIMREALLGEGEALSCRFI